jgi:hypothetical protein
MDEMSEWELNISASLAAEIVAEVDKVFKNELADIMHKQLKSDMKDIGFNLQSIYDMFIHKEFYTLKFEISIVRENREYTIYLQSYDRRLRIEHGKITLSETEQSAVEAKEIVQERFNILIKENPDQYKKLFNDLMASIENSSRQSLDELFYGTVSYMN